MARARRQASPRDMLLSLLVLLVPIILITLFFSRQVSSPPVTTVDWKPVLAQARSQADFPIYGPDALPQGWRPTHVSWVQRGNPDSNGSPVPADTWEFGTLNAQNVYLAVDQQAGGGPAFVAATSRNGAQDGQSTIGKNVWTRLVTDDRQQTRSLVLVSKQVTTVVTGDTSYAELESFVGMLTPS